MFKNKTCDTCGNTYDKAFEVIVNEVSHTFDSFECAIHALAPTCEHCQCKIVGHGAEADGKMYCSAHCANISGESFMKDRDDLEERATA